MEQGKIKKIVLASLFTALICIVSQVSVVTAGVPLTLQTFGVALCGYVLGVKWSFASLLTYLAVGSVGLPVFSGFKGGFQVMLGPTGGFLLGFIILNLLCSVVSKRKPIIAIPLSFVGIVLCHTLGVLQYSVVTKTPILASLLTASIPFVLKDIICVCLAYVLAKAIKNRLKGLNF